MTKAFKSQSQHSVSPIYNILLKLNSNFKDTSPYGDSLFPHTVLSACLLDIRTGLLHTISYGAGSQPPHVASLDRIMLQPAMVRNHFTDGVQVQTGTYELDLAQHLVTLGSPGLWCASSNVPFRLLPVWLNSGDLYGDLASPGLASLAVMLVWPLPRHACKTIQLI